ncbi:V/A-type H+-transporting ATPase subunit D [Pseudochelatococcus lubricantis]|uniref:V/A-type H+-transporting ATPase subunit D n=1 Tax=Pseudochelatococcus lubricantis TaxID=1538102 RepID=A0ABX0V2M8_9HYPH|nr:V-type ATP synthase subunit D [Pseudochelatococcus lubricantis]NIJ58359.1 V/A-type H+-transporting ATPase subunit D [Pseudochelatococcus lubricantis]
MAQIPLSKAQLAREKDSLAASRRFLPALDLKRQQLMAERNKARAASRETRAAAERAVVEAGAAIPMLADRRIDLKGLVKVEAVRIGERNVAGVRLPVVEDITITIRPYGRFARPHWVDDAVRRLAEAARLRIEAEVAERGVALLDKAVTRTTQRVNLFDKILIPQAEKNIRRILVAVGDNERAAVVGAKLAKKKREEHKFGGATGGSDGEGGV